jgi:drug/metabolite transporter (DMT)-like permease
VRVRAAARVGAAGTVPTAAEAEHDLARRVTVALAGIVIISFSAIIVRESGVPPATAAALRCAYALPLLVALALPTPRPPRRALALAFAGGVVLGVNLVLWHHAIGRIGAGFSTILANTHVLFVLLGVVAGGGAVARRSVAALPVPLAGIALIGGVGSSVHVDGVGIAFSLCAAALYAGFQLLFDRAIRIARGGVWPLCAVTAGGALAGFAAALAERENLVPPLSGQGWMLLLALGPQTAGWLLIGHGVARLRAFSVSLLLTLQPVLTAIWGVLAFGEDMQPLQIVGVALVLGGVLLARPARAVAARPG